MEECCSICADVLDFCAFGPCGHNTVCSKCVARLRQLQNSRECVFCKAPWEVVFVTKYMDEHTRRLPADAFQDLKSQARAPGNPAHLWYLRSIEAVFDDEDHFNRIKSSCGLTHPALTAVTSSELNIRSLEDLKRVIKTKLGLVFCSLCLEFRQVFVSEQLLYTKAALEEHNRKGDADGIMAESSFKGHPVCNFCKRRFYDDQKLYVHMELDHYHCHICRKRQPDKHKYYPSYDELHKHFCNEHYACPYERCLADKFVVFAEEYELKRHIASDHKDEVKMTNAERRQASRLPAGFHYGPSSSGHGGFDGDEVTQELRGGIVIGGGGAGGSVDQRANMRAREARAREVHSRHEAFQVALEQSVLEAEAAPPRPHTAPLALNADEQFPGLAATSSAASLAGGAIGRWAGGGGGRGGGSSVMNGASHFPTLGGGAPLSKGAKKKLKEKAKREGVGFGTTAGLPPPHIMAMTEPGTSAASSSRADTPFRALDRAGAAGPTFRDQPAAARPPRPSASATQLSSASYTQGQAVAAPQRSSSLTSDVNSFDCLSDEVDARGASPVRPPPQRRSGAEDYPTLTGALGGTAGAARGPMGAQTATPPRASAARAPPPAARAVADASFPALGPAAAAAAPSARAPTASPLLWSVVKTGRPAPAAAPEVERQPELTSIADFPSLAGKKGKAKANGKPAAAPSKKEGGISEELRAANEALIARIQARLSARDFNDFREQTAAFMRGSVTAAALHALCVALGLATEVPHMMALCPSEDLRAAMMRVHAAYLDALNDDAAPASSASTSEWVPPEAVAAATSAAASSSSWTCALCTLINAPSAENCSACGTSVMVSAAMRAQERKEADVGGGEAAGGKKGGKKKGVKMPLSQLNAVHPQNVWTQRR